MIGRVDGSEPRRLVHAAKVDAAPATVNVRVIAEFTDGIYHVDTRADGEEIVCKENRISGLYELAELRNEIRGEPQQLMDQH